MGKKTLSAKQLAALAKGRRKLAAIRKKKKKTGKGKRSTYRGPVLPQDRIGRRQGKGKAKSRSRRAKIRRAFKALGAVGGKVLGFLPATLKRWF